jgi:glycosyltransferase involved in cell wall biosynthesis
MRTLMLVDPGLGRPPVDELRRLIDDDHYPNVLALEDALGASLLDEHDIAALDGRWGALARRLPLPVAQAMLAHRRRRHFDVLVTWGERLSFPLAALLLATRARTPHVSILFWVTKPKKAVPLRLLHRGISVLLFPNPHQRRFARERLGVDEGRLPHLRWGTDVRFWRPLGARDGTGTDTICAVGREMRDYVTLAEALRGTGIPCHIAAGSVREQANPWLERLESPGGLPPEVTVGKRSFAELRALYTRSRFVVVPLLPSDTDNGLTSIGEALACGRPVIRTEIDGLRGAHEGLPFVRTVAPGDVTGLRTAIREWWADPEGCARLGAEGRAWVERNYSLGAWVDAVSSAARSALSDSVGDGGRTDGGGAAGGPR